MRTTMAGLAAILLALGAALTGCVYACPAIGWSNAVVVAVSGDAAAVHDVRLCVDGQCSDDPVDEDSMMIDSNIAPASHTGDEWSFTTWTASAQAMVEALDADGAVIARISTGLDWARVGGSEQCGGPGEARITITV